MEVYVTAKECYSKDSLCFHPELNPFVSWYVLFGTTVGYIVFTICISYWMKSRKPLNVNKLMIFYNVVQIILSAVMAIALFPHLKNNFFNINGLFCAHIEFWIFVHYCSKFLDMFDTLFMICRKKFNQLSFLHIYHHATIVFIWGVLLRSGVANGAAFFGAWINSFVHFLMYTHYLWTSFGFKNPFKTLLTKFQMFQFLLCILQAFLVIFYDHQFTLIWSLVQIFYQVSLFVLFLFFLLDSNKKSTRQVSSKAK